MEELTAQNVFDHFRKTEKAFVWPNIENRKILIRIFDLTTGANNFEFWLIDPENNFNIMKKFYIGTKTYNPEEIIFKLDKAIIKAKTERNLCLLKRVV